MAHDLELFFSILERKIDNRGKTPPFSESGYPLIEIKHIQENRLYPVFEDTKFVDQATWDTWFRDHLEPGDILFSTVGSIARSCLVPEQPKFGIAQNVLGFRVNRLKADSRYVYYAINGSFFQQEVHGRTIETVQKSIKVYDLKTCRIPLPSLSEQKAIASILGALDDKIELNRRMNETLEALAQSLFKSWFVDATQAALPKGWRAGTLGDIVELRTDRIEATPAKDTERYIALEDMPSKSIDLSNYQLGSAVNSSIIRFRKGDILFGSMRPYFHKVGLASFDGITRTTTFVLRPKQNHLRHFALFHFFSNEVIEFSTTSSVGTTIPYIKWDALERYQVALPPDARLEEVETAVAPLVQHIANNGEESRTLAALRDALLPKLLSGELRVPAAAKLTEAHA